MNILLAIRSWRNIIQTHTHSGGGKEAGGEKIRKAGSHSGSACRMIVSVYSYSLITSLALVD